MMTETVTRAPERRVARPESVTVKPLRLRFTFDSKVPRYWVDDDAFLTHFLNGLSLAFPDGERFFMDAVRAARDGVKDEVLLKEIQGFIAQEALHGDAHERLNAHLTEQGYPMDELVRNVKWLLAGGNKWFPKSTRLAATCGLEHITALLGDLVLGGPEFPGMLHESMRTLWVWHSIEETEHKGVAFDTYEQAYGDMKLHHLERVATMVVVTAILFPAVHYFQARLLAADGRAKSPGTWARGMWRLYGKGGFISRLAPGYMEYFRRDFHPWQMENSALIAKWKPQIAGYAG